MVLVVFVGKVYVTGLKIAGYFVQKSKGIHRFGDNHPGKENASVKKLNRCRKL
jgi:hypothetical protein